MQNIDKRTYLESVEMHGLTDCSEEAEELVIFQLVVPVAAKVPAPRPELEVAKLLLRQASVTSTVPGKILTQLRANNTATGVAWCVTATLASPRATKRSSVF